MSEIVEMTWQVRLNDFPDEPMYTLLIGGQALGEFHDWPGEWERGLRGPGVVISVLLERYC